MSEDFAIKTGVRQGDVALPLLFNTVIDAIMRKVFQSGHGVKFGMDDPVTDLMLADDSVMLAEDNTEATNTLHDITQIVQTFGFQINVEKTKILSRGGSPAYVHLNGVQIEQVTQFK